MEFAVNSWLVVLGLAVAFVVVFAWRSDILTGLIGIVLGVLCIRGLLNTIDVIDSQSAWAASSTPRTYYYVLVAACGIAVVTCVFYVIRGAFRYVAYRMAQRTADEHPHASGTKRCPYCGATVAAEAIACKYCEQDI